MNVQRPPIANEFDPLPVRLDPADGEELSALFENKEYLAGYLKAKERERIRFSRELHDSIGHLLIALRLDVSRLARTTAAGLAEAINDVQCDAHEIEDQIRALAFLHYPAELSRDGLPVALRSTSQGLANERGSGLRFGSRASAAI